MEFKLPDIVMKLVAARNSLRDHYSVYELAFTLDGNLVGDIGEAIASDLFGVRLVQQKGIDGFAPDGRSVQVKASGTRRGPAFRKVDQRADHLLCFGLDFENCKGRVVFNGPEHLALECMPPTWKSGQRMVSLSALEAANTRVDETQRLLPVIAKEKTK